MSFLKICSHNIINALKEICCSRILTGAFLQISVRNLWFLLELGIESVGRYEIKHSSPSGAEKKFETCPG